MTTLGTWYPPSCGTGSFLALANPPFAMTTTFTETTPPPPDQFRPRDRWFGPDQRVYRIKPSIVRGAVHLVDVVTGRHELRNARAIVGFHRQWWGGVR